MWVYCIFIDWVARGGGVGRFMVYLSYVIVMERYGFFFNLVENSPTKITSFIGRDVRFVRSIGHQTEKSGIAKRSGISGISVSMFLKEIAQYNFQLN